METTQNKEEISETNHFKAMLTIVAMVGTCGGMLVGFVSAALFIVNC